eukprot:1833394-Pyramimonas_sp.AAC.1
MPSRPMGILQRGIRQGYSLSSTREGLDDRWVRMHALAELQLAFSMCTQQDSSKQRSQPGALVDIGSKVNSISINSARGFDQQSRQHGHMPK